MVTIIVHLSHCERNGRYREERARSQASWEGNYMSVRNMLARTSVISVAALFFLPGSASGLPDGNAGAAALASRSPARPAVPSPGNSSSLQAVTCRSARDCWAVGSYETPSAQLNEALHWNGTRWSRVVTPDHGTGAGAHSSLAAVSCTSAGNCWAVGSYESGTISLNQALLWNGTRWSRVATPDPGDTAGGAYSLSGVSCVSRADCWAVGSHISDRRIGRNAALHWNGKNWSAVDIPSPGKNVVGDGRRLAGIACL